MTDMETDLIMYKAENKQLKEENKKLKELINELTIKYETTLLNNIKVNKKNSGMIESLQEVIENFQKEIEEHKNL